MIRSFAIVVPISFGQIVLDLISTNSEEPRKLYVMGKGIRRRSSDDAIVHSTNWGPLIFRESSRGTEMEGFEPMSSIILRGQDDVEIRLARILAYGTASSDHIGVIGISPGSAFLGAYPHFIIRPVASLTTSRLIMELAPSNIDQSCEGPMSYVDGIRSIWGLQSRGGPYTWHTHMIPRIISNEPNNQDAIRSVSGVGITYEMSASFFNFNEPYERLPWDLVIGPLIEYVESRSAARRFADSGNLTSDLKFINCNVRSIFPNILYSFYNREIDDLFYKKVDLVLYPEDYVDIAPESDGTSSCFAHIRYSPGSDESRLIGSNIVRAVGTHFDSVNRKIGFCDSAL